MDSSGATKPMVLDGQYIAPGNIKTIRMLVFNLMSNHHYSFFRKMPYPSYLGPTDEFNQLCLVDSCWGDCGVMELIDLDGRQTLVRFYLCGLIELSEIEEYERALRRQLSRPRIELWFFENLGWTAKVIEIFAEELFDHRVTFMRNIQNLVVHKLGLSPYLLTDFQILPASQIGISQIQSGSPQPQAGISQSQLDSPQPLVWISLLQPESQLLQNGISQIPHENLAPDVGVDRDITRKLPIEERGFSVAREDQELLRLWNDGLTAKEIGMRTRKAVKTISNRLSLLRGMYGEERVPLRKVPTRKRLG